MPHSVTKASKQLLNWESLWKMKPKSIHVRHLRIQLIVWNEIWFLRHSPDLQFSVLTFSSLLFTYATICILIYLKQMPHCVRKEWKQMLNWESLWKMKPKSIHVRHLRIQSTVWNKIWFLATFTRSLILCPYLLYAHRFKNYGCFALICFALLCFALHFIVLLCFTFVVCQKGRRQLLLWFFYNP